jgi:CheY-like chemotaxis protein
MHGGTVRAASEGLGRGSEFIVELPLAPGERASAASPGSAHDAGPPPQDQLRFGKRILIVDDNADAAESIAELLELSGNEIRIAHDGPEALRIVRGLAPDVCLVDIGLPVMDGYELARRLRESKQLAEGARLIAVTGYGQDADRERSRRAGFDAHLVKPVDLDLLARAIAEAS